jgi:hypothetical protein
MRDAPLIDASEQFYRYAYVETSVGRLLVVMTDEGIVDVVSGEDRKELVSTAMARHPGKGFIPDRGVHTHWVAAIVRRIEQPGCGHVVPIDLAAGYGRRAAG